jgi:hypothetical protein
VEMITNLSMTQDDSKGSDDGGRHAELLGFFWTFPSSRILGNRGYDVWICFRLQMRKEDTYSVGPLRKS